MFDITSIVEAIFALIAVIITTLVIPYIKGKTTSAQRDEINGWITIAVSAAEQIYTGSGRGQEKKEYVINWLTSHGVKVDAAKLDTMIEAAVYSLKSGLIQEGVITINET